MNRLDNEVNSLEEELSLTKYRLQKAEDFEDKYEALFKQHQGLSEEHDCNKQDLTNKTRESNELRAKLDAAELKIKNLEMDIENTKLASQAQIRRKEEDKDKVSNQGQEERATVEQQFLRQIDNIRSEARTREDKLKKELDEAQFLISSKEIVESSLKFKIDKIKTEKNEEISRLKELLSSLKAELSSTNLRNEEKKASIRTSLIEETESRIAHVRNLAQDIENTLLEEIRNLNETVTKKDAEIRFLLDVDLRQIKEN